MKEVVTDGYHFVFKEEGLEEAFIFDDKSIQALHLNTVDIIAEYREEDVFIELKRFDRQPSFKCPLSKNANVNNCPVGEDDQATINRIARDLRQKCLDTMVYRYAEGKELKDVIYVVVVGLDSALATRLNDIVGSQMPLGIPKKASLKRPLKRAIVKNTLVVSVKGWNQSFSERYGRCSRVDGLLERDT